MNSMIDEVLPTPLNVRIRDLQAERRLALQKLEGERLTLIREIKMMVPAGDQKDFVKNEGIVEKLVDSRNGVVAINVWVAQFRLPETKKLMNDLGETWKGVIKVEMADALINGYLVQITFSFAPRPE